MLNKCKDRGSDGQQGRRNEGNVFKLRVLSTNKKNDTENEETSETS